MAALIVQVSVSKKGFVVSNHDGSATFDTLKQVANYLAGYAFQQYGEKHVVAKTTVYDNYVQKDAITAWFAANPISRTDSILEGHDPVSVQIDWRLKF